MSADLTWLLTRNTSSFLVKRKGNTAIQLSRDPANLTNVHSFKYAGLNNKVYSGIKQRIASLIGGVTVSTKKQALANKPGKAVVTKKFAHTGRRGVSNQVSKIVKSYRGDLVKAALARASRIIDTQAEGKKAPVKKLRGKKAIKA
ncbi:ribosomal protein L28e [Obelidium mucronatum]|nr:ribosomal protein L28e [Obelidium mucronatum]